MNIQTHHSKLKTILHTFPSPQKSLIFSALLTMIAFGMFIAGVRSLVILCRSNTPSATQHDDPFFNPIHLLFSTDPQTEEFRKRQRKTIWLFCGSMLLLFVARFVFVKTIQG